MLIVNQTKFKLNNLWLKEIVQQIWRVLGLDTTKIINLVFVKASEIKKLNQQYRQQNKVTDILSFNYQEADFGSKNIKSDKTWGELIVCLTQIKKQAKARKIPWQTELTLILIHGILHLIGWDHATESDSQQMEAKTRFVLGELNF